MTTTVMRLRVGRVASPLGTILLVWDEDGALRALDFADYEPRLHRLLRRHYGSCVLEEGRAPADVTRPLDAFFAGDLGALAAVAVRTSGTAFQQRVWSKLREIPAGTTTTYGALAGAIGQTERQPCRRSRQRRQPHRHHRPVPSGDRCRRDAHGLRRRYRTQALAVGARRRVERRPWKEIGMTHRERSERFRALHAPGRILVLPNAWDAGSARLIESCGAAAIATTSSGVAWSCGYPDGNALPTGVLVEVVARITRVLSVPLTVDAEAGYSKDPAAVGES